MSRRRTKPIGRKPTLSEVDLTRSSADLMELTGRSQSTVVRARRAAGLTKPQAPRHAAPRPPAPPKPPATPRARPERSSPRESAATVAPPAPAPANNVDAAIRAALVDEMRGMGVSPFVASVVIAARFRVAREEVERIAEDVAGMRQTRREVSNG